MATGKWLVLGNALVGGAVLAAVGLATVGLVGTARANQGEPTIIGSLQTYTTVHEDTLLDVARRYDLGFVELVAANPGLDPWLPGEGVTLLIPTAHLLPDGIRQGIVVNLTEMRMYYYRHAGQPPETHPVGIGSEGNNTPVSTTHVTHKMANPVWVPPASIRKEKPELPAVVAAGPDNPMGLFALYLGFPGGNWRIHGTNEPYAVGRRVTHGCMRLYPEDIEDLFHKVDSGTSVTIIDQPVKVGWVNGELYLEVHPTKQQADELEETHHMTEVEATEALPLARKAAGDAISRLDEPTVLRAARERRGYPIRITQ